MKPENISTQRISDVILITKEEWCKGLFSIMKGS
jgi:hypothetical protein